MDPALPRQVRIGANDCDIIRYALWAVVGFVGSEAYTKFLLRGDIIE